MVPLPMQLSGKAHLKQEAGKKSPVDKKQKSFHLPTDILDAIEKNSPGNMSVFVEKILREYFEQNNMI